MKEERLAILRMVAEGKINAEEAEMLLEALGGPEKGAREQARAWRKQRRGRDDFTRGMGNFMHGIMQDVVGSVNEAMGSAFNSFEKEFEFFDQEFDAAPEIITVSPGTTLGIESNSGALTLFGSDEPRLKISGTLKRHYSIKQQDDKVIVKANRFGVALTVHVPRAVERLMVKTNLGEILARNFTNSLKEVQIETHTGNIGLEIGPVREGRFMLKSHTGLIKLILSEQSACSIKASATHLGEIETTLPLEVSERGAGYLVGTLNGGGAKIGLTTHTGEIFIEPARQGSRGAGFDASSAERGQGSRGAREQGSGGAASSAWSTPPAPPGSPQPPQPPQPPIPPSLPIA